MRVLLGGAASPTGWAVQYVDAPLESVLDGLVSWRRGFGQRLEVLDAEAFPEVLDRLAPFQSPWTRELVLSCGTWTAYLNNRIDGGDLTAAAVVIAKQLEVCWVGAQHTPMRDPGHQATQLWVTGSWGDPPVQYDRTIAAFAQDGRWGWSESGRPLPFEDLTRYQARRKRDRFDRQLLLDYLEALGIPTDDVAAYGPGVLIQQQADWHVSRPPRSVTVAEARAGIRAGQAPPA